MRLVQRNPNLIGLYCNYYSLNKGFAESDRISDIKNVLSNSLIEARAGFSNCQAF